MLKSSKRGMPTFSHFPALPQDSTNRHCEGPMQASLCPSTGLKIPAGLRCSCSQLFRYSRIPSAKISVGIRRSVNRTKISWVSRLYASWETTTPTSSEGNQPRSNSLTSRIRRRRNFLKSRRAVDPSSAQKTTEVLSLKLIAISCWRQRHHSASTSSSFSFESSFLSKRGGSDASFHFPQSANTGRQYAKREKQGP